MESLRYYLYVVKRTIRISRNQISNTLANKSKVDSSPVIVVQNPEGMNTNEYSVVRGAHGYRWLTRPGYRFSQSLRSPLSYIYKNICCESKVMKILDSN